MLIMAFLIVAVVFVYFLFKNFIKHKYNRLRAYGIPSGPKPSLSKLGNLLEFKSELNSISKKKEKIHHYSKTLYEWSKKYGSIWSYYEVFTPVVVLSDADLVCDIFLHENQNILHRRSYPLGKRAHEKDAYLFLNKGARYERVRKCMEKILCKPSNVLECLVNQDSSFELIFEKCVQLQNFDIYQQVRHLSANTMFESCFGVKINEFGLKNERKENELKLIKGLSENFDVAFKKFQKPTILRTLSLLFRKYDWFFYMVFKIQVKIFSLLKLNDFVDPLFWFNKNYIRKARMIKTEKFSFFKQFLNFTNISHLTDTYLTMNEAESNFLLIFFAGFETTSAALAFTCHVLSHNKAECNKLINEFKSLNKNIEIEDLSRLKYLDCFVKEVLRMYPIANSMVARESSVSDFKIKDNLTIPKGVTIVVDVLSIHYNQKLWGSYDVFEFHPERFFNLNIHPAAWLPFGLY